MNDSGNNLSQTSKAKISKKLPPRPKSVNQGSFLEHKDFKQSLTRPSSASRGSFSDFKELKNKTTSQKNKAAKKGCNIQVVVRLRDLNLNERLSKSPAVVQIPPNSTKEIRIKNDTYDKREPPCFRFDKAFGPEVTQKDLFDSVVSPILDEVLMGFNCTVFAYGQTGTGKTYTMEGDLSSTPSYLSHSAGVIPRTLDELFKRLGDDLNKYTVRLSMLELYNEEVGDLLSMGNQVSKLALVNDANNKLQIQGIEEILIEDTQSGISLLKSGSAKRHTAATNSNLKSSRSHCIFTITVRIKESSPDGPDLIKEGKLYLVDLAGSEDTKVSGAINMQAREAGLINQSLLSLGRVITSLVAREESNSSIHIPYRESKLTRILQDSLGGQTKTCVIATISPAKSSLEETISTLKYATKAMKITNMPVSNQIMTNVTQIRDLKQEIASLRTKLQVAYDKTGIYIDKETYETMLNDAQYHKEQLNIVTSEKEEISSSLKRELENHRATRLDLAHKNSVIENITCKLHEKTLECRSLNLKLEELQNSVEEEEALKNAYKDSESRLDTVAKKLLEQLDNRIANINDLNLKIVTKNQIEKENFEELDVLETKVTKTVSDLHSKLVGAKTEQANLFLEIHSSLDSFKTNIDEHSLKFTQETEANKQTVYSSLLNFRSSLEQHEITLQKITSRVRATCEEAESFGSSCHENLFKSIEDYKQKERKRNRLFEKELNRSSEQVRAQLNLIKDEMNRQTKVHKEEILALVEKLSCQDSEEISHLRKQVKTLQDAIFDYRRREPEMVAQLTSVFTDSLGKLSSLGSALHETTYRASNALEEQIKTRLALTTQNTHSLKNLDLAFDSLKQKYEASSNELYNQQSAITTNFVSCTASASKQQIKYINDFLETQSANQDTASAFIKTNLEALNEIETTNSTKMKDSERKLEIVRDQLGRAHEHIHSSHLSQKECMIDFSSNLVSSLNHFENQHDSMISECSTLANQPLELTLAMQKNLKSYIPRGTTPTPQNSGYERNWNCINASHIINQIRDNRTKASHTVEQSHDQHTDTSESSLSQYFSNISSSSKASSYSQTSTTQKRPRSESKAGSRSQSKMSRASKPSDAK